MTRIQESTYRGRPAIRLSSGYLEAVFFTDFGAKMVSLKNLDTGYEFLQQGKEPVHPEPEYGSLYVENDLCGADDMFPSINESFYPLPPWRGIPCPPHGELWSIPWTAEPEKTSVTFAARGVRLPYSFRRRVTFRDEATLRFDYTITNKSVFDLAGIWAFHPLFNAGADSRVVLPAGAGRIINTLNVSNRLGKTGSIHPWPETVDKNGGSYNLSSFNPGCGTCEKFFFYDALPEGTAALERKKTGSSVKLSFPTDTVPYLGVWINQGGVLGQNNIALEPASGALDDIYVSNMWEQCSRIPAWGEYRFYLEIKIY
jgi:galactose mutarotase-like enzyme